MSKEEAIKYYSEHKSELNKQMYEIGYNPHDIVTEAYKDGMTYQEFIVSFLLE